MKPVSKTMQGSICGLRITQHHLSFPFFLPFSPKGTRVPGLSFLYSKQLHTVMFTNSFTVAVYTCNTAASL